MTSVKPEILSHLGIGSGMDTTRIVDALVDAEVAGSKESLEKEVKEHETDISAFSKIRSNLKTFNENLKLIQNSGDLGYQGATSDKTIATFEANGNTAAQSINSSLTVSTLATAHTLTGPSLASTNSTVGARTIQISFGSWSADPTAGGGQTHTSNGQSTISVTATSSTTLLQLRDMINTAATDSDNDGSKDVTASVLYDGTNYMLSLKSEFGASNEMKVTDNHATPAYAYDTTDGAKLTQRVAGGNSSFSVDGISMTRSSNLVDDLYPGMSLQLLKTSSDPITITSEVDLTKAEDAISAYVETYNDIYRSLEELRKFNRDNPEESGVLAGSSLLRSIMTELRESNATPINGYAGGPYYLSSLGVKTNRDGLLSFNDPSMLKKHFDNNAESLRSFFKNQIVSTNPVIEPAVYNIANSVPGSYAVVVSGGSVSIGGIAASASGGVHTVGSGDPNGIGVTVSASDTTGTIHYGRSHLTLLQEKLEAFVKYDGLISSKVRNSEKRLSDLAQNQEALEIRIEKLRERYRSQYAAMESQIASLNETGDMLKAAFAQKDN